MSIQDKVQTLKKVLICLHKFGNEIANKNVDFVKKWIAINYGYTRLRQVLKMRFTCLKLPDRIVQNCARKKCNELDYFVDPSACILASSILVGLPGWSYVCSLASRRMYKVFVVPLDEITDNAICVSETMIFNLNKHLGVDEKNHPFYFLLPEKGEFQCAKKAAVSLVASTQNYSDSLIRSLLENYFVTPRFLRTNDIFCTGIKEFAAEFFYANEFPNLIQLYFKVNLVDGEFCPGKYILKGETELVQENNVRSYVPRRSFYEARKEQVKFEDVVGLKDNCPPGLEKHLSELERCVAPFLQRDSRLNIRPVFLIRGSQGCGKYRLVQTLAKRKGIHLVSVCFSETRTLATAQKEAKLRMTLQNALDCTPCILMLQNIEIVGINMEGKKDDRSLATFSAELTNAFESELKFPMIVIATTEVTDLSVQLEMNFIETISIKHMSREEKYETLAWLLEARKIKYTADLKTVVEKCSDFNLADFEALVHHAIKNCYKSLSENEKQRMESFELNLDHFNTAYEWMQRMFSDEMGAPRIPKVHWEDIGGLAELKSEIMRRIELPMLLSSDGEKSGLLLYGPPGTGKTLLAKAVATEYQFHFLSVKGPELLNMYVGQSEENVRQIFEKARAAAPCIIFFDELDSLAPNRGHSGDSGGVMDRVVSQLLTELDGIESNGHMVVIGATNRPDLIDPALLRPGRFDKMLYVGMYTDRESQVSVLRALSRKFNLEKNGEELEELVEYLPSNLTGADLYGICSDAWMIAVRKFVLANEKGLESCEFEKDPVVVTLDDFKEALRGFKPSISAEEIAKYNKLKEELS